MTTKSAFEWTSRKRYVRPPALPVPRRFRVCRSAVLALATVVLSTCARRPPPYNVLLISLDTVRQDVLGCYGRRPRHAPALSPTPELDALAAAGVRMVDAYAPSSWTLPSHLSLLTGQPPLVHGVETEVGTLDPATPTMAEILRRHGYRTVGIYSAPYLEPHWGFGRGFDRYDAVYDAGVVAASDRAAEIRRVVDQAVASVDWKRYDDVKRQQVAIDAELNRRSEQAVTSDQVTAAVTSQMETLARDGRPWFLFAHFFDAHCDYVPPPPYDRRFDPDYAGTISGTACLAGPEIGSPDPDRPGGLVRRVSDRDLEHVVALYEGEVAWVDAHVGTIVRALDALGLAQKTLVVVVSDHGEEFFEHGGLGHRRTLREEVIRVPVLLRLPGVLPAGAAVQGPVSLTDVLPTVIDVLGLPAERTPGASSFLPLIRGTAGPATRAALFRVVMMFEGDVEVDSTQHVTLRQIMVADGYRTGTLKVTRTRRWPQFPADLPADLKTVLQREAAAQYEREDIRWIDVARAPAEPEAEESTAFGPPAPRAALDAFRRAYAALASGRSRRHHGSPVPENVRLRLESLGYVDTGSGPEFPEPDVLLPPPGAG